MSKRNGVSAQDGRGPLSGKAFPLVPLDPPGSPLTDPPPSTFKICCIGDAGVGKTALRQRFLDGRFTHAYRTTLGADFTTKTVTLPTPSDSSSNPPRKVKLQVWDTAGSERFRALGSAFYRGADACVLVYSSTDRKSLKNLKTWMEDFAEKRPITEDEEDNFIWVAVGAKTDLLEGLEEGDEAKTVSPSPPASSSAGSAWRAHDSFGHGDCITRQEAATFLKSLLPPPAEPDPGSGPIPFSIPPGYTRAEARGELTREMPLHPEGLNGTPPRMETLKSAAVKGERERDGLSTPQTPEYRQRRRSSAPGSQLTTTTTTLSIYHTPPSSVRRTGSSSSASSTGTVTRRGENGEATPTMEEPPSQDPPSTATAFPLPPPAETLPTPDPDSHASSNGDATPRLNHHSPLPSPSCNLAITNDPRVFPLFLTSSKTGDNIDALFTWLGERCVEREDRERARMERDGEDRGAEEERRRAEVKLREVGEGKGWKGRCCGS